MLGKEDSYQQKKRARRSTQGRGEGKEDLPLEIGKLKRGQDVKSRSRAATSRVGKGSVWTARREETGDLQIGALVKGYHILFSLRDD